MLHGWSPHAVGALHVRCTALTVQLRAVAMALRATSPLHPSIDQAHQVVTRLLAEWDHDLRPAVERVVHSTFPQVAASLLDSWLDAPPPGAFVDRRANPADALFARILADGRAGEFVVLAADRPSILFDTAADHHLAERIAREGVATLDARTAERVLVAFLRWFQTYERTHSPVDETYIPTWRLLLVDLVVPWTMQLSPLDTTWRTPPDERAALLARVLDDDAALARLVARTDDVVANMVRTLDDALALERYAAYLGMLGGLVGLEQVADEAARLARWDLLWSSLRVGASAVVVGVAATVAVKLAVTGIERAAAAWAPDPLRTAADADFAHRWTMTLAAASIAAATWEQWRTTGAIPTSTAAPPWPSRDADDPATDFLIRFTSWRDDLPGGADGALADRISRLVYTVLNPHDAGQGTATVVRSSTLDAAVGDTITSNDQSPGPVNVTTPL
ncbi:MAG: hypothetical protein ACKOA2_08705 [Ilumatobacteraceae bacterium]